MKKIVSVFVIIISLVSCNSNDDQVKSVEDISKRLKSIKTSTSSTIYEYGTNNFVKKVYKRNSNDVVTVDYIYNSNNQIVGMNQQTESKQYDGTFKNYVLNATYQYSNGLLVSSTEALGNLEEAERSIIDCKYEYNNGNLIKKIVEVTDLYNNFTVRHTFYTYNSNKLKSFETKVLKDGNYENGSVIITLDYDSKINPEYKIFPESFLKINFLINSNNIISYTDSVNDHVFGYNALVTYDKDDFPQEIIMKYKNGKEVTYVYEYE